jgi:flavin reductase (DIM6/NTAB) family NADH-FMN oxidoreductase RutF
LSTSTSSSVSSSESAADGAPLLDRNIMTISWLTPTNNIGGFMCSMNANRCTARRFVRQAGDRFVLSVPVRGMEDLVRAIGSCSGDDTTASSSSSSSASSSSAEVEDVDISASTASSSTAAAAMSVDTKIVNKIERLNINICRPSSLAPVSAPSFSSSSSSSASAASSSSLSSTSDSENDESLDLFGVRGCCAFLVCSVQKAVLSSDAEPLVAGQNILICQVERAYVHKGYWAGANFLPTNKSLPPYLKFLGHGNFAHVVPPSSGF